MAAQRTAGRLVAAEVEAVLAASRVLVGVAAQSLADVEDTVTVPQLRALMMLATRGPLHLTALAEDMGVHPSNATRACDRLVAAGLLDRRDNPADRRHLLLDLTPAGQALIDGVVARRRAAIEKILRRMPRARSAHNSARRCTTSPTPAASPARRTCGRWAGSAEQQSPTQPATGTAPGARPDQNGRRSPMIRTDRRGHRSQRRSRARRGARIRRPRGAGWRCSRAEKRAWPAPPGRPRRRRNGSVVPTDVADSDQVTLPPTASRTSSGRSTSG